MRGIRGLVEDKECTGHLNPDGMMRVYLDYDDDSGIVFDVDEMISDFINYFPRENGDLERMMRHFQRWERMIRKAVEEEGHE